MSYIWPMVFYRRNFIPGGTYFFTVALADRKRDWLVRHIDLLRLAFRRARRQRPFAIDAIVVLPEHLHCIWTLPLGDADYSHRWRLIKSARFRKIYCWRTFRSIKMPRENTTYGNGGFGNTRCAMKLICLRMWITSITTRSSTVSYTRLSDWRYTSFHRFVRMGWLSADWADDSNLAEGTTGE